VEFRETGFHLLILALLFVSVLICFGGFVMMSVVFRLYLMMLILHWEWSWSALALAVVLLLISIGVAVIFRFRIAKPFFPAALSGLAAFVGWMLSRILPKKQRTYVPGRIREANHRSEEIRLARKSEHLKDQGGLLSLVLELLEPSQSAWCNAISSRGVLPSIVRLHNPPEPELSFADLSRKDAPKNGNRLPDHRSETSPEKAESEKPYQKSVVALFKNTASEWIQDKCPQLGAALERHPIMNARACDGIRAWVIKASDDSRAIKA
jgi:hypothetical protein